MFGLMRPYKGIDVLLDAWRGAEGEGPIEDAELLIAGMPRMDISELRAAAPANVSFDPHFVTDEELPAYFERADLVVLPYLQADQSGVLFTALAFGKPLLLSDVGGFPELQSTGAASIVKAADPRALGKALRDLLADRATLTEMCVRARAAANGRYSWKAIAAAHVEHDGADAAPHRYFRAHAVRPEAVELAVLQRLRRHDAEIRHVAENAGHRRDVDLVAIEIDAGGHQQPAQAGIDPWRGADGAAFDDAEIAALGADIGAHHQEPVHALGLGGDQLGAFITGKRRRDCVRGAADEIDLAVAQCLVGLVDRVDQLERDIEPFGFEETELDRGLGEPQRLCESRNLHLSETLRRIEPPLSKRPVDFTPDRRDAGPHHFCDLGVGIA